MQRRLRSVYEKAIAASDLAEVFGAGDEEIKRQENWLLDLFHCQRSQSTPRILLL
jgi:hypothetical protein